MTRLSGYGLPYEVEAEKDRKEKEAALRDQFAMAALMGLCASNMVPNNKQAYAKHAFEIADAMLEARK